MIKTLKNNKVISIDNLMIIACFFTEICLYFWTKLSVANQMTVNESLKNSVTGEVIGQYRICFAILLAVGVIASIIWKKKSPCRVGIMCFVFLINIGASIAYRTGERITVKYKNDERIEIPHHFMADYQKDIIAMMIVFAVGFLLVRFLPKLYKHSAVNWFLAVVSIITLLAARAFGPKADGSYLTVFGIMTFAIVLAIFPLLAGFFMSRSEKSYLNGSVGILSANMFLLLLITAFLFIGCLITNENGLLLVLGVTLTIIFFIGCPTVLVKIFYSAVAAVGCLGVIAISSHIKNRIDIWLDPVSASKNGLSQQAESVLYLFRHFKQMGWYGNGIGDLSHGIYPTLNNDHVLVTLINDYSIILAAIAVLVMVVLIRWMLNDYNSLDRYDRFFNLACSMVFICTLLLHFSSNLGSFIVAGVGFPFISDGSTINYMFTWLLAAHCGLVQRIWAERTTKGENI